MSSIQDFYLGDPADAGGRSERYSIPLDGSRLSIGPFPFRPRSVVLVNQTAANMIVQDDRGEQYIAAQSIGATYGAGDTVRFTAWLDARQTSGKATVVVSDQPAGISAAQLSSFATIGSDLAGGTLVYAENPAAVLIVATTEATANTVLDSGLHQFDGTTIDIEFWAARWIIPPAANGFFTVTLWDGGTNLSVIGVVVNPSAAGQAQGPFISKRRLTPTQGGHQYIVKAYRDTGAAPGYELDAGPGNAGGAMVPMFVKITKA